MSAAYVILRLPISPHSTQRVVGYGETFGGDRVKSAFQTYLDVLDINPPQLKATNEDVGKFLDFLAEERQPTDDENSGECLPNLDFKDKEQLVEGLITPASLSPAFIDCMFFMCLFRI